MASYIWGPNTGVQSPEELARRRDIIAAMAARRGAPKNVGEGLTAVGQALAYRMAQGKASRAEAAGRSQANDLFNSIFSGGDGAGATPSVSGSVPPDAAKDPVTSRIDQGFAPFETSASSPEWEPIKQGIFAGESKGDYDALFGFSNREGGQFANTKLTNMTVDEALAFSDPSGPYGQWVKGKVGRVATPMGGYQVVGTTLKAAKQGLGLKGDERMTPQLQDRIGQWIYNNQGVDAWAGYKGPRQGLPGQVQIASADPSFMPSALPQGDLPADPQAAAKARLAAALQARQGPQDGQAAITQALTPQAPVQGVPSGREPVPVQEMLPQRQPAPVAAPAPPQQVAQAAPASPTGGVDPRLIEALGNKYLTPGQRAVVEAKLRQQMQASDPMRQMELERGRLELDRLRNLQLPDSVRALQERAKLAGLQPGTPEYTNFMVSGGSKGITVNNNMGPNSSEFAKESDKKAAERLGTIVEEGRGAAGMMADMKTLADLGAQIDTGLGAQAMVAFGPYAQALGINIEGLAPAQAYEAIISRLAPQMRPAGAGATSDFDARQFLNSLPSLGKTPEGNEIINQTFQAVAQNKMSAAEIAAKAQMGEITWQQAEREIAKLPDPYEIFQASRSDGKKAGTPAPEGVDQSLWDVMTPEERALWK